MKIGIMSMQRIVNYGSYLQAYGLKKSIEKFNHNVQFIDYHAGKPLSALPTLSKQNKLKKFFLKRHKFSLFRLKIFQKKFKNYFNNLGFADNEFDMYISWKNRKADTGMCNDYKPLIISFANLLYKIDLDDKDKKLLYKTFKKNKKMLKALDVRKKDFSIEMIDAVEEALSYCYQLKEA